ncbi:MAG TPA: sigma-70 region 4 domain-containing protein [Mycobacteriales bacterium]|nr:sigma-70 region 4 domain-containing protein [Mycobacteriales bacterium]HWB65874.1 sigma-70 region 4 domain-containing protein [Mycobacteriales bacterium]
MPRDVVALVSVDDFVSVVRVYADRVNDLLRRSGVPAPEAVEVCETHAHGLLDAVVNAPETVVDLAGWWFGRTIELIGQAVDPTAATGRSESGSVFAGSDTEELTRAALAELPDAERLAVVLRDAYDLPSQAVAVALRRDEATVADLIAVGRMHLIAAYDDVRPPDLGGHTGRTTVDLTTLSRYAESTLLPVRATSLRRHLTTCPACDQVVEALARARRLAAGLPIVAMADEDRELLIDEITERAVVVLPSHNAVLRAVDEDHDPSPAVSPLVAAIAVAITLALAIAVAVISHSNSATGPAFGTLPSTGPTVQPAFSVEPTRTRHRSASPSPTASPTPSPTASTPSPSPTPSVTATGPPPGSHPAIALSPTSGPEGSPVTVHGSGWPPDDRVTITYAGSNAVTARADDTGSFTATVTARSALFGQRRVTATDGSHTVTVFFRQQF